MNAPGKQKLMSFPGLPIWFVARVSSYVGRFWVLTTLASLLIVTDGVLLSALVFVAMTAPSFISSPLGGWWADLKPPAEVIRVVATTRAVLFILIALTASLGLPAPVIIATTTLYGFAHAASSSAESLILHSLVPDAVFPKALSSVDSAVQVGMALGSLGAAFVMPGSIVTAAAVAVFGELVVLVAVRNVSAPEGHVSYDAAGKKSFPNPFQGIPEGVRVVRSSSVLKFTFFFYALRLTLLAVPLYAARVVDLDPVSWLPSEPASMVGVLSAVAQVSAALTALALAKVLSAKNAEFFLLSSVVVTGLVFTLWSYSSAFLIVILAAAIHQSAALVNDLATKLVVHTRVALQTRGRVLGLLRTVVGAVTLGPVSLIGYIVGLYGFGTTAVLGLCAFVVSALSFTTLRHLLQAEPIN